MGRPPCCDNIGVKKGPWTPEEDIVLVSYIQEHGPGNWKSIPTNTGLLRCSKSCRLRWTNYLRSGIKRGDFTEEEDTKIVQLQALLGNSSLFDLISQVGPQRTDNDIKNYWNTYLKKKINKLDINSDKVSNHRDVSTSSEFNTSGKRQCERKLQTDMHMARKALLDALSLNNKSTASWQLQQQPPYTTLIAPIYHQPKLLPPPPGTFNTANYELSAENIERLLPNWLKKNHPKSSQTSSESISTLNPQFVISPPVSEGFKNYRNSGVSETTILFQDEMKPEIVEPQMPSLSFLGDCFFYAAAAHGHDISFMNMSLEDSGNLF